MWRLSRGQSKANKLYRLDNYAFKYSSDSFRKYSSSAHTSCIVDFILDHSCCLPLKTWIFICEGGVSGMISFVLLVWIMKKTLSPFSLRVTKLCVVIAVKFYFLYPQVGLCRIEHYVDNRDKRSTFAFHNITFRKISDSCRRRRLWMGLPH